jgi:hypothetical protein
MVRMPKTITMPMEKFLAEHKKLIPLLRSGSKEARAAEAADQEKEVASYTGGRLYPYQYSVPVRMVLDAVSLGEPQVLGSSEDNQILFSGDYDLLEYVPFRAGSVRAFQRLMDSCEKVGVITDIKCGEIPEWNLLSTVKYSQEKELAHLRRLWQEKVITDNERKMGEALLKPRLTNAEKVAARKKLRFGILRWTPGEVRRGHITLRDKTVFRLEDAMKTKGITKVDVVAWVKDKYVEVSNIILWTKRGGVPYAHIPNVRQSLAADADYYLHEGNFFKAAKRLYAIAKNRKDQTVMDALRTMLNSPLGAVYTVVSDLKVLDEFPKAVQTEKKRVELDLMRDRMAKLYFPEFDRAKNPSTLLPRLEEVLQENSRKALEELGFLPFPRLYRPIRP